MTLKQTERIDHLMGQCVHFKVLIYLLSVNRYNQMGRYESLELQMDELTLRI